MVLEHNTEQKKKHNTSFHSKYYILKMPSITLLNTQQTDREHYAWPYVTQEEISRIPVYVLRRAMSGVHDRLAECEQRNGGHLEDVIFRVE